MRYTEQWKNISSSEFVWAQSSVWRHISSFFICHELQTSIAHLSEFCPESYIPVYVHDSDRIPRRGRGVTIPVYKRMFLGQPLRIYRGYYDLDLRFTVTFTEDVLQHRCTLEMVHIIHTSGSTDLSGPFYNLRFVGLSVCLFVCLQTLSMPAVFDLRKVGCLHVIAILLWSITFRWPQCWPFCDLDPVNPDDHAGDSVFHKPIFVYIFKRMEKIQKKTVSHISIT